MSNKGDFLDYTALQKRGLLKRIPKEVEEKNEYASFISPQDEKVPSLFTDPLAPATPTSPESNAFAFLDSLASSSPTPQSSVPVNNIDFADISVKIENLEYKIERFIERLTQVEDKIEKFRAKVG